MSRYPDGPSLLGAACACALTYAAAGSFLHAPLAETAIGPSGGGLAGLIASSAMADEAATDADLSRDGGFGLGRAATEEEIAAWDIDIRPDGQGLPDGSGDVMTGEQVYIDKCSACHGDFGEGRGRWPQLAGGQDTLERRDPVKTVGSYWPYLSTVVDYVHRAMPFGDAQSLSADEVYALTAYILYLNNLVEDDFTLSPETFAEVEMPNADGFRMDDRPEVELDQWRREPCMEDCKDTVEITMHANVLDVTPGSDEVDGGEDTEAAAPSDASATAAADTTEAGTDRSGTGTPEPELVAAGEKVFRQCNACHMIGDGAENRVGPVLNGVVGREAGSVEEFRYSPALKDAHFDWSKERLTEFLADPRGYLKGNRMSFGGLTDEADIEAVIAFLQSHGG